MDENSNNNKYFGQWWIPNNQKKVPGDLYFDSQNEITLIVYDSFQEETEIINRKSLSYPLIYGVTNDDTKFTLHNVYEIDTVTTNFKISSIKMITEELYKGSIHFNPDQHLIISANLGFANLRNWVNRNSIKSIPLNTEVNDKAVHGIYIDDQEEIKVFIEEINADITIYENNKTSSSIHSYQVIRDEFIEIKPKKPQKIDWFERVIQNLQVLLTILLSHPTNYVGLSFEIYDESHGEISNNHKMYPFIDYILPFKTTEEELHFYEIPFLYGLISEQWSDILKNWFKLEDKIGIIARLYFGIRLNKKSPLEYRFLTLIQALESYLRTFDDNFYINKEEYKKSVLPLLTNSIWLLPINESLKNSLIESFNFSNELALKVKLKKLCYSLPPNLKLRLFKDIDKEVNRIVNTRNSLVHRNKAKKNILSNEDIYWSSEKLGVIIEFFILKEMGLNEKLVVEVMLKHRSYAWRYQ